MLGLLGGVLVVFGPPVALVLGIVAVWKGRWVRWARLGFDLSLVTFAFWVLTVVGRG